MPINNLVKELVRNVQYSIKLLRSSTDYTRNKNNMKKTEDTKHVISVYRRESHLPTNNSSECVPKFRYGKTEVVSTVQISPVLR
jgi:hypothetical protein